MHATLAFHFPPALRRTRIGRRLRKMKKNQDQGSSSHPASQQSIHGPPLHLPRLSLLSCRHRVHDCGVHVPLWTDWALSDEPTVLQALRLRSTVRTHPAPLPSPGYPKNRIKFRKA